MRKFHLSLPLVALALTLPPLPAPAQEIHGAHEHGVGQLNLAIEGSEVEIELIAPGADIVGFEHAAETAEQKAAVSAAADRLEDGAALFVLPEAAGCSLEEAEGESSLLSEADHHDEEHEDEHEHGHEHEHEDEHDHAQDEGGHAEFHAHYHFDCTEVEAVSELATTYFEQFPAAERLSVQYLTGRGQGAADLTPANPRLRF